MTTPNAFLSFQGQNPADGHREAFDAVSGANPPTITGGYAKWSMIERPMQRSLTIPESIDPVTMTADIIFGSWLGQYGLPRGLQDSDVVGQRVETDISSLEWMAGGGGANGFKAGMAPWVYVTAWSDVGKHTQSGLIPVRYRGLPWVITGLSWGQAWRNGSAYRIYQEATVTLTNYLNLTPAGPSQDQTGGSWFTSAPGLDTALKIAGSHGVNSPTVDIQSVAQSILNADQNNPCKGTRIRLQRRSVSWTVRHGTRVFVPSHTVN